jgi:hypothetical protein
MKAYVGVDVSIHIFLTSALVGCEWSASRSSRFTSQGKSPRYPLDRRLVELQSRSGRRGEETNFLPCPHSNTEPSVVQPAASRYTDCAIPDPKCIIIIIIIIIII